MAANDTPEPPDLPPAAPPAPPPDDETVSPYEDAPDTSAFYRFSAFLGVLALVALAAALVLYNISGMTQNIGALLGVALVLGVLYIIPRFEGLLAGAQTRTARRGGTVTVASVAFVGLLIVINWYANRHSPRWDLTASGRYTLSDQTQKIIKNLNQDVKITAFFPSRSGDSYITGTMDLLRLYDRASDHISLDFVDPDVNPGAARQFQITTYPVTIFQSGDRKEQTTGVTEQDFTSALLKVTRNTKKKVYFLQGEQERDITASDATGYSQAADALKQENYDVATLSLLATPTVPDDAAVLIIAGPKASLLDPEKQAISDYLDHGGHMLYLADPKQDVGLGPLLEPWHIALDNDIVIDQGRSYPGDPLTPAPIPQQGHRITTALPDLLLPGARSMQITPGAGADLAIFPLLKTSPQSWGETNFSAPAKPDPEDVKPPLTLAVSVSRTGLQAGAAGAGPTPTPDQKKLLGRIEVVGNSEFAANTYFKQVMGNKDFFLNSINWLAEDEDLISIRAEPAAAPPIVLTNQSSVLVFYSSVVFVPLAVLLLGGVVWWQRR